jgi:hypothetical protein
MAGSKKANALQQLRDARNGVKRTIEDASLSGLFRLLGYYRRKTRRYTMFHLLKHRFGKVSEAMVNFKTLRWNGFRLHIQDPNGMRVSF